MDWSRLSPPNLEDLVGDLLEADRSGAPFERFGPGPDGGIDLRRKQANGTLEIVQVKHYRASGWEALLRELKREANRVPSLRPDRYIVATSVDVSSDDRKKTVMALFDPWIRAESDVVGGRDIEALLRRHPKVERSHPTLWMPTADVLERLLHAGVFRNTAWTVEEAEQDTRLFVRPQAYDEARERLAANKVCIVSGPPGIGKTTLAHMLLLEYVRDGFTPVVLRSSIDEGVDLYRDGERQFFLFDDFLGQTDVSEATLGRNEDDLLLRFLNKVRNGPDKRLVMTTREYVLRDALRVFERLRRADAQRELERIVLDLEKYARLDKARILYNHAWALGSETWEVVPPLGADLAWKPIVDHPNFSPRLVRMTLQDAARRCIAPSEVPALLTHNLENPIALWEGAFGHLDDVERAVLRAVAAEPGLVSDSELFRCATARVRAELGIVLTRDRFVAALGVLEGTFVRYERPDRSSEFCVGLANPSVKDFLLDQATSDAHRLESWLAGASRARHLGTLVQATTWSANRGNSLASSWLSTSGTRLIARLESLLPHDQAAIQGYEPAYTDFVRALTQCVQGGTQAKWRQHLVEQVGVLLAREQRAADPASIVTLIQASEGTDESMRPWLSLAVAQVWDLDDIEALCEVMGQRPLLFDEDATRAFLDAARERIGEQRLWALREADDEESALSAVDQIERIADQLGISSPIGFDDRDRISERLQDRNQSTYGEERRVGRVREDGDDLAISRLFQTGSPIG